VLQWWWLGTDAAQTYESCIDFVLGAAPQGGPNKAAIERQNLQNAQTVISSPGTGGKAGAGAPAVDGPSPASFTVSAAPSPASNAAVAVPEEAQDGEPVAAADGSFGGVQGVAPVSDGGEVAADAVPVEVGAESFGGVTDTVPISARLSRLFRGRV